MKVQLAKLAFYVLLLLGLSGCGVFEIGIELPVTPTVLLPTNLPTRTLPPTTSTPLPGHLKAGSPVQITRIQMLNKTSGWGIGRSQPDPSDHILFTTDGGHTWQDRTPTEILLTFPENGLTATAFFDIGGRAWVTYASRSPEIRPERQLLWHTTDFGQTWQLGSELALIDFQAEYFIPGQMGFNDEQHGWLLAHVGAGMSHDYIVAFTTQDAGQSWQRVLDAEKNPDLMGCQKTGLAFSTETNGWLAGNCPGLIDRLFFYFTTNGGQTWQPVSLITPASQPADLFTSGKAGCGIPELVNVTERNTLLTVRCEFTSAKTVITWLYTDQNGGALEARALPLPYGALQFLDVDEGWLVGAQTNDPAAPGEIFHTLDGGRSWTPVISTAWQGQPNFIDSSTGWVVARTDEQLALVYTTNGGLLWEEINPEIGE